MASTALKVLSTPSASIRAVSRAATGIALAVLGVDQGHFHAGAQAGQGRAQVVGDGVAGVAQAAHQPLDAVEHVVEALGQLVVLVAGAAHPGAGVQVAGPHRVHDVDQALHAARDVAADQHPAGQAQDDHQRPGPAQGPDDLHHIAFRLLDVGPDEQGLAAAQALLHAPRRALDLGAVDVGLGELEGLPGRAGPFEVVDRRLLDRAGDPLAVLVEQQVQERPLAGGALDDGLVQGVDPAHPIGGLQALHLAGDVGVGATVHLAGGGDVDVAQERAGGRREQGQEQQGQPERRGSDQARQAHGLALLAHQGGDVAATVEDAKDANAGVVRQGVVDDEPRGDGEAVRIASKISFATPGLNANLDRQAQTSRRKHAPARAAPLFSAIQA
jgi:hypothetical protein